MPGREGRLTHERGGKGFERRGGTVALGAYALAFRIDLGLVVSAGNAGGPPACVFAAAAGPGISAIGH